MKLSSLLAGLAWPGMVWLGPGHSLAWLAGWLAGWLGSARGWLSAGTSRTGLAELSGLSCVCLDWPWHCCYLRTLTASDLAGWTWAGVKLPGCAGSQTQQRAMPPRHPLCSDFSRLPSLVCLLGCSLRFLETGTVFATPHKTLQKKHGRPVRVMVCSLYR